ncbi:hypothetical protein LGM60_28595 [Burkholderia vietnamiensis]|nr:hypothetical protein [Burkholderia vietnamiensis]
MLVGTVSQYVTHGGKSWVWGDDLFPVGFAIRHRGDMLERYADCWLVQEDDVRNLSVTPFVRRTSGCCGMTGDHGPNLVCTCGAHVASAETDCSVLNFVALDGAATRPVTLRKHYSAAR